MHEEAKPETMRSAVDSAAKGRPAGALEEESLPGSAAAAPPAPQSAAAAAAAEAPATAVLRLEAEVAERRARLASENGCERARALLAVSLVDLGTNLRFCGRSEEGVRRYVEGKALNPEYAAAHYNLGVAAAEAGRVGEALAHYDAALRCNPLCVEAICNVGVIARQQGRLEDSCEQFERALRIRPRLEVATQNYAVALSDLGTRKQNAGQPLEAVALYKRSLLLSPMYADAYYNLGVAAASLDPAVHPTAGDEAVYYYTLAVHFRPTYAEAWNNLGVMHKQQGVLHKAVECYEQALRLNDTFVQTMNNLAILVAQGGQMDRAQTLLRRAIELAPAHAETYNNLGVVLRDEGISDEALRCYEKCLELCPDAENAAQNVLLALNFSLDRPTAQVQTTHLQWGARISAKHNPDGRVAHSRKAGGRRVEGGPRRAPSAPLRVGYVSPDFCLHSVSYFIHSILRHHTEAVEVVCFSGTARPDSKTFALRSLVKAENWVDIVGLATADAARVIAARDVDILVDLTGHTASNRLDVFLQRPAPVQVTWIGYPNTTGLKEIGYRLTDARADPWDLPDVAAHYSETLYRLPSSFLCYCPDSAPTGDGKKPEAAVAGAGDAPPVADEERARETAAAAAALAVHNKGDLKPVIPERSALERNGHLTFGTFNNMAKVNDDVLDVWGRVLARLPTARLLLKSKPFAEARVRNQMLARLAARGVTADRVDLMGVIPQHYNHLQAYEKIDVALDCWPYAGTTTTCEALWMGKPVVTLCGDRHATNVGASLLTSVGCPELIARTRDEYVEIAASLADPTRLAAYQKNLQRNMAASPLCNGAKFIKELEEAYRNMWTAHEDGKKVCVFLFVEDATQHATRNTHHRTHSTCRRPLLNPSPLNSHQKRVSKKNKSHFVLYKSESKPNQNKTKERKQKKKKKETETETEKKETCTAKMIGTGKEGRSSGSLFFGYGGCSLLPSLFPPIHTEPYPKKKNTAWMQSFHLYP